MVIDDLLTVPEGGTTFICVNVTNSQQLREIDIILSFSVTEGISMFMSQVLHAFIAFLLNFIGENMNFQILNDTTFIITRDVSQVCLQFVAFDDNIAEDPEQVIVTIATDDVIVGCTIVIITDNDGMAIIILYVHM